MNRVVPDFGPYDAPLLIVGEAGGKEEGAKGRPFVGVTGRRVRELIALAGLDPERQRYANVIPVEMATLPKTPYAMQAVVRQHWHAIEATLLRGEHKAVLAYGRAALWRLAGRTKITDEHGSVSHVEIGGHQVPMVASIHPAAVMRSKIEAGWTLVRAATDRACRYADGRLVFNGARQLPHQRWCYDAAAIDDIHQTAVTTGQPVAIDTEYDRVTRRPFIIGLSVDGESVVTVMPIDDTIGALRRLLDDNRVTKLMHHAPADLSSLEVLGLTVRPPLVDTLMLYATVFPDLPVGLARVALHLLDHWHEWKGMTHDDPVYNAIDVVATWRAYSILHRLMTEGNLWPVWTREVRHVGVLCMAMEARGLAVDPSAQRQAVEANALTANKLKEEVSGHVDALFARRRLPFEARLVAIEFQLGEIKQPRLKRDRDPAIDAIVTALRKERMGCATKIERWSHGFDLGNNDHLRWLLYDVDGFKLPPQRSPEGRPTANADAIARLLALKKVQESPVIRAVLVGVKEYQHLRKMTNTFLLWNEEGDCASAAVDKQGSAHPEYRAFGTGTGRLAGGPDSDLGDRTTNPYAFNALNIPESTRCIYVPHSMAFKVDTAAIAMEIIENDTDDWLAAGVVPGVL